MGFSVTPMCYGDRCRLRHTCARYLDVPTRFGTQMWFETIPYDKIKKDCAFYIVYTGRKIENNYDDSRNNNKKN